MLKSYSIRVQDLYDAANLILKTIGATFGPKGKTVLIQRSSGLVSTKDGQTVLWELCPENKIQRMIILLIQEACSRINKEVGDGTTTAALFIANLLKESLRWREAGASIDEIIRDFSEISEATLDGSFDFLSRFVESEEELYHIALVSSNYDDEMAKAVSKAMVMAGIEGLVSVETGVSRKIEIIQKPGYEFDKGYESLDLTNNKERHFDECLIALVDATLTKVEEITPILEEATQFPYPLLIVSRGLFGLALKTVCMNDRKLQREDGQVFEFCAVRVPGHPDQMRDFIEDIQALSGATIWSPGLMPFDKEFFGSAQEAHIYPNTTRLLSFPDREGSLLRRCHVLRNREKSNTDFEFDTDMLNRRISMLSDGLVVLKVGGTTELEMREKKGRVEDALFSVRSCVEGGVIPGGAKAYIELSRMIESQTPGKRSVAAAALSVAKTLLGSSGKEPTQIIESISDTVWEGYDIREERIRDFWQNPKLIESYEGFLRTLRISFSVVSEILKLEGALVR